MEMTAHQRHFGVNDEDEPFVFLWTHDEDRDFVFSLTRPVDGGDATPIKYMVLDQMYEAITDVDCQIDDDCIRAQVPIALRQYTSNSDEIVVYHRCTGDTLRELIDVLRAIFKGKAGLTIHVN